MLRCVCIVIATPSLAFAAVPHDAHLDFDGANDIATIESSPQVSPTSQITVEAWLSPVTLATDNNQDRVVSKSGSYELTVSTGDTGCGFGTRGAVQWRATIGGVDARICGGQLTTGVWRHIVGTYDGARFTLYVDGAQVASATRSGALAVNSAPLTLGNRPALDRAFDGALDEVRIWRRALGQAELQANDRPLTGGEIDLAAYFRLDDAAGQSLTDTTVNANHGTLGASAAAESSDPVWIGSPTANTPPVVDAGADQTAPWSGNPVQLLGAAHDDGLPSGQLSYVWSVSSGPSGVSIANPTALQTSATFAQPGVYLLNLRVSDGALASNDAVQITLQGSSPGIATVEIAPKFVTLGPREAQEFTAIARDSAGRIVPAAPTWTTSAGVITSTGAYTAPDAAARASITANADGVSANATVDVTASATIWPASAWTVATPASVNMNAALLAQARDYALTGGGAGMIVRRGRQVLAWGSTTTRYDVKSVTKSIGSAALGLALLDGSVAMSDLAVNHLSTFGLPPQSNAATGWRGDITLLHLATQTSGFDKSGGYTALLFAPGSQWAYSDGGANWLADVLTSVFADDLRSVLFARAFTPMGIRGADLTWRSNAYREDLLNGVKRREFGAGVSLNVNAMARIGYLYLRRGLWNGQRILPDAFIEQVQRPDPAVLGVPVRDAAKHPNASRHYGVLWWTNADGALPDAPRDVHWAWGLGDGLIVVIPSLDVVAVRAGAAWRGGAWTSNYAVVEPFITPIARSVQAP